MLTSTARKIKAIVNRRLSLSAIKEQPSIFDTPSFVDQTNRLNDLFIRKHALDIIQKGYTVINNSVKEFLIDEAIDSFYAWKKRNYAKFIPGFFKSNAILERIVNIHATLPQFWPLFSTNKALLIQDYLFGMETILYTSLFFETGTSQAIHRDTPLFWTKPANMYFGTWLALEKTDCENGPLIVIPGSHRLPILDRSSIAHSKYADLSEIKDIDGDLWEIYQNKVSQMCVDQGLQIEEVYVDKGDTVIWHPMLAHGGAKIIDPQRSRLSFVIHTTPKGTPVYHTDVFFDVKRRVSGKPSWGYKDIGGRLMMNSDHFSIGHSNDDYDYGQLL